MKLQGSCDSRKGRSEVYSFLTDPARLVQTLRGLTTSAVTPEGFVVHTDLGLGPFHRSIDVQVCLQDLQPDRQASYRVEGDGPVGSLHLLATLTFSDRPGMDGTHIAWSANTATDGPLAPMVDGILESTARQNVDRVVASMEQLMDDQQTRR